MAQTLDEIPIPSVGELFTDLVVKPNGDSRDLLVMLHGAWAGPSALASVQKACRDLLPDTDLFCPDYPAGVFADDSPQAIADEFRQLVVDVLKLREARPDGRAYDSVQLLGWSIGTPIVLRAYIDARLEGWAPQVSRLILFAAHTWGWTLKEQPPNMPTARFLAYKAIIAAMSWTRDAQTVRQIQRELPFTKQLQQDWADLLLAHPDDLPEIVAFDGAEDEWLGPHDKEVISKFPNYREVVVPQSGHVSLALMDDSLHGLARRAAFAEVFQVTPPVAEQIGLEAIKEKEARERPESFAL